MGGIDDCGLPPLKRIKLSSQYQSSLTSMAVSSSLEALATPPAQNADVAMVDDEATVGPNGLIRKVELVRIITQSLRALGYEKPAALLEEESGIPLDSTSVLDFKRQVLDGKWDESLDTLRSMSNVDEDSFTRTAFLIFQEKFFERLSAGNVGGALATLRSEIAPLKIAKDKLHNLAACVVSSSRLNSMLRAKADGANSRFQLLQEIQGVLPPSLIIPDRRLEHLIEQALSVQTKGCIFHNSMDQAISLYSNHKCGREQIPSQTLQVLVEHQNEVWFLQFSHDGQHLASASKDCTAIVWEVVGQDFVKLKYILKGHQKPVSFVAWSPDDRMVLTCGNEEPVKLWSIVSGECLCTFSKSSNNFSICAWFPDSKTFICGEGDKGMCMWNIEGKELDFVNGSQISGIKDVTISPDGCHLICVSDKRVRILNLKTQVERWICVESNITSLCLSKDGRYLLVNLVSERIHLWDIMDCPKLLFKYQGHRQTRYVIRSCFGGFNQAFIVSGSEDSQVYIWHRGNEELLEVLPGHSGTVNCVSWNPANPHMFASASDDHTIRIWGLNKEACKEKIAGANDYGTHPWNKNLFS